MIEKTIEKVLYRIGIIISFIGIYLFVIDIGFGMNTLFKDIVINIILPLNIIISLITICIIIFDILILEPILFIKNYINKKRLLSEIEENKDVFREFMYLIISIYCMIMYFIILIYTIVYREFDLSIVTLYELLLCIIILRKNIIEISKKTCLCKVNIIKILSYLCILWNIYSYLCILGNVYSIVNYMSSNMINVIEDNKVISNILLIILIIELIWDVKLNISYLKNKDKEKRIEIRKKSIILQVFNLMAFSFLIVNTMPYILIIFELLKELKKDIKTEKGKIGFILYSILVILYPVLMISLIIFQ